MESKKKVVVFGSGPKFIGFGLYNTSLAKALDKFPDTEVYLVSWSHPYPAIIPRDSVDHSSKTEELLEGTNVNLKYVTNFNNPLTWYKTYKLIKKINPDVAVFQWAISVQGIPIGYIVNKLKKKTNTEIIFDLHFVKQKEESLLDKLLTKKALKNADSYITHDYKTAEELKEVFPEYKFELNENGERAKGDTKTIIKLFHPLYDTFKLDPNFDIEKHKKELNLRKHVFLFFGFIRKYKGLHDAIRAFAKVVQKRDDASLLIVGQSFWNKQNTTGRIAKIKKFAFNVVRSLFLKKMDVEQDYRPLELIDELGISDYVTVVNDFVPNEDVHKYFQVSDCIVLYYLKATASGPEHIAYNFNVPALATKVGHFPETIRHGYNGYLADPNDVDSMAQQMINFIEKPIPPEHVTEICKELSWENYAGKILKGIQ
ncbi:MAG: glycosyltransferase [Calditrichaeota bacterium]|nr:glycosyltransferase [Calditrichota bacterium]